MTGNPYLNAGIASAYIVVLVLLLSTWVDGPAEQTTLGPILIPMLMLSLLVLSAAIMGFLFFYKPTTMILDGKREEAVGFFMRTVITFAALTSVILVAVLSLVA